MSSTGVGFYSFETTSISFSPSGNLLYSYDSKATRQIAQWNLNASDINASYQVLNVVVDGDFNGVTRLKLAPNRKIYVTEQGTSNLGIIHFPDVVGLGCNYQASALNFNGKTVGSYIGSPTMDLMKYIRTKKNCDTWCNNQYSMSCEFSVASNDSYDSLRWNFGEPSSGLNNTSTTNNPTHIYANVGTYDVTLIQYGVNGSSNIDTLNAKIVVGLPNDFIHISNDTTVCGNSNVTLQVNEEKIASVTWTGGGISGSDKTVTVSPNITTTYTANLKIKTGSNLIVNGDFESDTMGFTSDYLYSSMGSNFLSGRYGVGKLPPTNTSNVQFYFPFNTLSDPPYNAYVNAMASPRADVVPGLDRRDEYRTGKVLYVDGACGEYGKSAGINVWCQSVNVQPNTEYDLTAHFIKISAISEAGSILQFTINGVNVSTPYTLSSNLNSDLWNKHSVLWNSGFATTASICIKEISGVCSGNNFAIDGISLQEVCNFQQQVTVNVVSDYSVGLVASKTSICAGESVTLTANGALKYVWSGGNVHGDGDTKIVTPNTTTTYKVSGFIGDCVREETITIVVEDLTNPILTASKINICSGEVITLTASGATIYNWDNGITNTNAQQTVAPNTTTTYQVSSVCGDTTQLTITVNPNITPIFNPIGTICANDFISLPSISNNGIYGSWTPFFNPSQSTSYTFMPASGQCATGTTMNVLVQPQIQPIFTAQNPICIGGNFSLPSISNNGISGTWSQAINNSVTTTYTFTPTSGQCASALATMTIVVNSSNPPIFEQIQPICAGTHFTLPSFSANGVLGIWSPAINFNQTESLSRNESNKNTKNTNIILQNFSRAVPPYKTRKQILLKHRDKQACTLSITTKNSHTLG